SAVNPPSGCPFHPRCQHPAKDEQCRTVRPELRELGPEHGAACHKAG
ncbi:MAG: oligopeptide ABC transporter ATP-binding protein OppF, partial [Gemmatimonadota bacterium]